MAESDISLSQWVVGGVAAGILAALGFLTRFVFGGVFKRLDDLADETKESNVQQIAEIRAVAATVQSVTTDLAVANMRIAHLEASFAAQLVKFDDMGRFLAAEGFRKRDG